MERTEATSESVCVCVEFKGGQEVEWEREKRPLPCGYRDLIQLRQDRPWCVYQSPNGQVASIKHHFPRPSECVRDWMSWFVYLWSPRGVCDSWKMEFCLCYFLFLHLFFFFFKHVMRLQVCFLFPRVALQPPSACADLFSLAPLRWKTCTMNS